MYPTILFIMIRKTLIKIKFWMCLSYEIENKKIYHVYIISDRNTMIRGKTQNNQINQNHCSILDKSYNTSHFERENLIV